MSADLAAPADDHDGEDYPNYGSCPWYRTRGMPDSQRRVCTFGCVDEPVCETCEPEGGWPITANPDWEAQR